jgi:hypothetical protein
VSLVRRPSPVACIAMLRYRTTALGESSPPRCGRICHRSELPLLGYYTRELFRYLLIFPFWSRAVLGTIYGAMWTASSSERAPSASVTRGVCVGKSGRSIYGAY